MTQKEILDKIAASNRRWLAQKQVAQQQELLRVFQAARAQIEAAMADSFAGADTWNLADMRRFGRYERLLAQIDSITNQVKQSGTASMENYFADQFANAYYRAAWELDSATPGNYSVNFNVIPYDTIRGIVSEPWKGAMFSDRMGLITDDMSRRIQNQLAQSMIAGESLDKAAKRIRDEVGTRGKAAADRALMITRTEITRAQGNARFLVFSQNEDVMEVPIWKAHPGACEICSELDGKPAENPKAWQWFSKELQDDVFGPPAHPRCSCDIEFKLKPWKDIASEEFKKIQPRYIPMDQWAQERGIDMNDLKTAFGSALNA